MSQCRLCCEEVLWSACMLACHYTGGGILRLVDTPSEHLLDSQLQAAITQTTQNIGKLQAAAFGSTF